MQSSVAEFFNRNTRVVTEIIDQTFFRLMEPTGPLDRFMPVANYPSRKLLLLKFKGHRPTIASIIGEDQEVPASRPRATLDEQLLGNMKIGKQLLWTGRDFEMMYEMKRYLQEAGSQSAEAANMIKKHFFGEAADLVPSVLEKHTVLTLQVACTGSVTFTDPLSNAVVEFTYPNLVSELLPAALTGASAWTEPGTSTPLTNFETHARAYYDRLGYWPPVVIMHFEDLRHVADSDEAKTAYIRKMGADSANPDLTGIYLTDEETMDLIRQRTRSTEVLLFDAQYSEEQADQTVIDKFFLPRHYYLFAKEGYLERALVPTIERDFQPGIYFHTKVVDESPRKERSVAVANGLPLVKDERCIAARKVA